MMSGMSAPETRNCRSCKKQFVIEPDDFAFYETIHVPAPTRCPECRLMRRMSFRNEITFYKRQCNLCKKERGLHRSSAGSSVFVCPRSYSNTLASAPNSSII